MESLSQSDLWKTYTFIRPYHPWLGGGNSAFRRPTDGKLLDLKDGKEDGIDKAVSDLFRAFKAFSLAENLVLVVVPGHDARPTNRERPVAIAIERLAVKRTSWTAEVDILIRHKKVNKHAHGGTRSKGVFLNSVEVSPQRRVSGRTVIIVDDITTSGHSLLAARQLIEEAGAARVGAIAIGKTTYE